MINSLIGTDPEFLVINPQSKKCVSAVDILQGKNLNGEFGTDGNSRTFELRPKPDTDPFILVNNIYKLFKKNLNGGIFDYLDVYTHSTYESELATGGHIHLEIPKEVYKNNLEVFIDNNYISLVNYISFPLFLIDSYKHKINRIVNIGYGNLYDYRHQTWGIELRAPGNWLGSPHIAATALCLAKMVSYELFNNSVNLQYKKEIEYRDSLYKFDETKKLVNLYNEKIRPDLMNMKLYPLYKTQINTINYLIDNGLCWYTKKNFKESWGLTPTKPIQNKFNTTLESIWS